MADGYGMRQTSTTGVEGLVSWSSIGAFVDCIGLDQFLHEDPSNPKEPGRGEHRTNSSLDERLGFVPSPENDQSFFQDFDLKTPAVSSQPPITLDDNAKSEIVIAEDHPFQISFSDLDMEETFELADEETGVWRGSLKELCLEEMDIQCQVPEGVSDLPEGVRDLLSLCNGSGSSSNPEVCEEQRVMLPSFENPSLLESCLNSITSRLPLEAENPSPSPSVENSRKVKTKEENWNKNDADAKKERRRLQNRTAARRCRNRKKECIESMLKTIEKANSEKEHYRNIVVTLKAQIVMLTQELRQHQLHCSLIRKNTPCISSNSGSSGSSNNNVHPTLPNTRSSIILSPQITNQRFS